MLKDLWIKCLYITAEVDGVGQKGSEDTTAVQVETLLGAFVEAFQTWVLSSTAKVSGISEDHSQN
jgi:hypothetical protein